ncbi:hypothetical protein LTR85_010204 [Meristemomyces frigidus]|nr:hypothetical protein LTR85_010204 [Meristemomyces frigidus]
MDSAAVARVHAAYKPLQPHQTRVLCLEPGRFGAQLIGSLKYTTRASLGEYEDGSDGRYEALSYAWGEVVLDHELELREFGQIKITVSLYSALQQFRLQDASRNIWVDAVCIDQSNNAERAMQVDMMASIFAAATRVLAWLGDSEPENTLAFATIRACMAVFEDKDRELGQASPYTKRTGEADRLRKSLTEHPACLCCGQSVQLSNNGLLEEGFVALANLLQRNYFSRLWVVQEVVQCHTIEVFCGRHHVDWDLLFRCQQAVNQAKTDLTVNHELITPLFMRWFAYGYNNMRQIERIRNALSPGYMLQHLVDGLVEFSNRKCYDPRDRVYAIMEMYRHRVEPFQSDYQVEPMEVYRDFTVRCMTQGGFGAGEPYVSVLLGLTGREHLVPRSAGVGLTGDERRPSWVPHYHCLFDRAPRKLRHYKKYKSNKKTIPFDAGVQQLICRPSAADKSHLEIRGMFIGTILAICHEATPAGVHHDDKKISMVDELIPWYCHVRRFMHEQGLTDISSDECRALLSFQQVTQELKPGRPTEDIELGVRLASPDFETFKQQARVILEACEGSADEHIDYDVAYRVLLPALGGTVELPDLHLSLCVMQGNQQRRLAWVPWSTQIGDKTSVFAGALQPLVLRDLPAAVLGEAPRYRLIGDAWVLGTDQNAASGTDSKGKIDAEYERRLEWITLV